MRDDCDSVTYVSKGTVAIDGTVSFADEGYQELLCQVDYGGAHGEFFDMVTAADLLSTSERRWHTGDMNCTFSIGYKINDSNITCRFTGSIANSIATIYAR